VEFSGGTLEHDGSAFVIEQDVVERHARDERKAVVTSTEEDPS
jgi:hypothetical protein